MAFEKAARLRAPLAILVCRNFAQPHRDLVGGRFQFALGRRAAAEGEYAKAFAHEIQCLPQRAGVRVGAEITRSVILLEPSEAKARPFLALVHLDEEETLVVAKRDIVAGPVFLDQFAF